MTDYEKKRTGLLHATDELRKLILEHPELPLLVLAGEDCNSGDYSYMSCSRMTVSIGEFLDCQQTPNEEHVYIDRVDLEYDIEFRSDFTGTNEEFTAYIKSRMAEYEPYWKPCIILYADN